MLSIVIEVSWQFLCYFSTHFPVGAAHIVVEPLPASSSLI